MKLIIQTVKKVSPHPKCIATVYLMKLENENVVLISTVSNIDRYRVSVCRTFSATT